MTATEADRATEEPKWFTNRLPDRSKRNVKKGGEISAENIVPTKTRRSGAKTVDYRALTRKPKVAHDKKNVTGVTDAMEDMDMNKNKKTRKRISLSKKKKNEEEEEEEKETKEEKKEDKTEGLPKETLNKLTDLGATFAFRKTYKYLDSIVPSNLHVLFNMVFDEDQRFKSEKYDLSDLVLDEFVLPSQDLGELPGTEEEKRQMVMFGEGDRGELLFTKLSEKEHNFNVWLLDEHNKIHEPFTFAELVDSLEVDH